MEAEDSGALVGTAVMESGKFERIVLFLASVPIFKQQLPRSLLPQVAQELRETVWAPGKALIRQGEIGRTFFLIYSGTAAVMAADADGRERETATLSAGDWAGGHTLTSERPNVATIVAKGPVPLVTLSLSRRAFELSGIRRHLRLPRRPALLPDAESYVGAALGNGSPYKMGGSTSSGSGARPGPRDEELALVTAAIHNNPHLRAFCDLVPGTASARAAAAGAEGEGTHGLHGLHVDGGELLRAIAVSAERREVPSGAVVARRGELGQEFFIVRQGSFEMAVEDPSSPVQRSAEAALASFSMSQRTRRKQHFLLQLHRPLAAPDRGKKCLSVLIRDPRDRPEAHTHPRFVAGHETASCLDLAQARETEAPERPPSSPAAVQLRSGDSFGELSLLYNIRREATFRACEDSVVYVICRRHFKTLTSQNNGRRRFREKCALLDEVGVLGCLLRSERRELACNASDPVTFPPGHRILRQGKEREMKFWYVIHSGSVVMKEDTVDAKGDVVSTPIGAIVRPGHFGERSLLKGEKGGKCVSELNMDAGPGGLTCLLFDGEMIRELLSSIARLDSSVLPSQECSISEWGELKRRSRASACSVELGNLQGVSVLGKGAFGAVFLTQDTVEQKVYALKRVSKGHAQRAGTLDQLCWERDLLSMLDSPFIIHLFKTFKDEQFIYLLMEVALGGDLYEMLCHHPQVFLEDRPRGSATAFYSACVVAGLEHLHERKIIYRDMKPENVMLDNHGYAKICDLGLARFVCGKTNTQVGTPDYMPPEMIDPPHYYDASVDWWSLGVLSFELLCRQTPYDDEGLEDLEERILAIRRSQEQGPQFLHECPEKAKDFVSGLLQKLPNRLGSVGGADAIRRHPFFQQLDFNFEALHSQTLPPPHLPSWSEPEVSVQPGFHRQVSANDELYSPYVYDGDNWDEDF